MQCQENILNLFHGLSTRQCTARALVGKSRCRFHDPECVALKEKKELEKYKVLSDLVSCFGSIRPAIHRKVGREGFIVTFNFPNEEAVKNFAKNKSRS